MSDTTIQLILLVILLSLSAVFSASETALTTLSKIRLRNMQEEKVKGAELLHKLTKSPKNLITTILVVNNLINIGASALMTTLTIKLYNDNNSLVAILTGLLTILILNVSEITPKTLAAQNSEKVSLAVSKIINLCMIVCKPVVYILNFTTNFLLKLFGGDPERENLPLITESEFKTLVKVGEEEGVLEIEEKRMIDNVFGFGNTCASDVMTPRIDMISIPDDSTYNDVREIFLSENFTRLPVYKDSTDNIIGMINLKDFAFKDINNFNVSNYLRNVYFTYESKATSELFKEMRSKRISVAVVIDEYGGTSGIVTLEDLIEEIVGDIEDEYDDVVRDIQVIKEDEYIVKGTTRLDYLNDMIGTNFESEGFDTLGGYIMELLGRIPEVGENVNDATVKFIIEKINKNRIEKIRVYT